MSGRRYLSITTDPFEDEVDDEAFATNYRSRIPTSDPKSQTTSLIELEDQRQSMLQQQREIEQRTLDSSSRSIGLLYETTQIGIATAGELSHQNEQLQNIDTRLDEMHTNLRDSQKHIKGIKSIFDGLRNNLTRNTQSRQISPCANKAGTSSKSADRIEDKKNMDITDNFSEHPTSFLDLNEQTTADPIFNTQRENKVVADNLDVMIDQIGILKGLGIALGHEIQQQNNLIDKIQDKVEDADIKIGQQNKQIKKLLGK